MAGYTRTDVSDNIANTKIANADDLDNEFNAIQSAFNASTGHVHDGTTGNGAPITKVGPAQDLIVSAVSVLPKTNNTLDLGSSGSKFKDLYIDGTGYLDAAVLTTVDINGGTVDGVVIGGSVPGAITGTTITGDSFVGPLTGTASNATTAVTLTGLTPTVTELNYVDGVTSSLQTQLDNKQPLDAGLTSISGLTTAANKMIYTTDSDVYAVADLTAAGRALLDDASAAAQLVTLGINATATELNSLSGIPSTVSGTELGYVDGVTSSIQTQLDNKQPLDADLTAVAALSATGVIARTGAGTVATRTITGNSSLTVANGDGVAGDPTLTPVLASQAQAEAGSDNVTLMTPLRIEQHMVANDIGWGQTWQNVLASRVGGTSYQNTTTRPIMVNMVVDTASKNVQVSSDNATWITIGITGSSKATFSFVVPVSWYYRLDTTATINAWVELR